MMNIMPNKPSRRTFEWAAIFCIISVVGVSLEAALKKLDEEKTSLQVQLVSLQNSIQEAEVKQHNLIRQINSQSDPAWIELQLKQELGLVPEGQKKIYFPP